MTEQDAVKIAVKLAEDAFSMNASEFLSLRFRYPPDDVETIRMLKRKRTPAAPSPSDPPGLDPELARILRDLSRNPHEQAEHEKQFHDLSNDWITTWLVDVAFEQDCMEVPDALLGLVVEGKAPDGYWGATILVDDATGAAEIVELNRVEKWHQRTGPECH